MPGFQKTKIAFWSISGGFTLYRQILKYIKNHIDRQKIIKLKKEKGSKTYKSCYA